MKRPAGDWIESLQLTPHVEGGAYRQTYHANLIIDQSQLPAAFHASRPVSTAIYFLLQQGQFSALHRIAADELWHFYYGDPLIVFEIDAAGMLIEHLLGNDPANSESFQCVVTAGNWFGAQVKAGGEYSLVGCTVSPGFDFADFELGNREALLKKFPQHAAIIQALTR